MTRRVVGLPCCAGVAVLVLLAGTGLGWWNGSPSGGGGRLAKPLAVETSLDPNPAFFGDPVEAQVTVQVDPKVVAPDERARRRRASLPYSANGACRRSPAPTPGSAETIVYRYTLQCLTDDCLPLGNAEAHPLSRRGRDRPRRRREADGEGARGGPSTSPRGCRRPTWPAGSHFHRACDAAAAPVRGLAGRGSRRVLAVAAIVLGAGGARLLVPRAPAARGASPRACGGGTGRASSALAYAREAAAAARRRRPAQGARAARRDARQTKASRRSPRRRGDVGLGRETPPSRADARARRRGRGGDARDRERRSVSRPSVRRRPGARGARLRTAAVRVVAGG